MSATPTEIQHEDDVEVVLKMRANLPQALSETLKLLPLEAVYGSRKASRCKGSWSGKKKISFFKKWAIAVSLTN